MVIDVLNRTILHREKISIFILEYATRLKRWIFPFAYLKNRVSIRTARLSFGLDISLLLLLGWSLAPFSAESARGMR